MAMDQYTEAAQYIVAHRQQGANDQQIRQHFTDHGWTEEHIREAFKRADDPQTSALPAPLQPAQVEQPPANLSMAGQPKKYGVFRAVKDSLIAMKHNPAAYIFSLVTGLVVFFGGFMLIILISPRSVIGDSPASGVGTIVGVIVYLIAIVVWYALSTAYMMVTLARTLRDGHEGRKSPVKQLLMQSPKVVPRVALANALGFIITVGPILIALAGFLVVTIAAITTGSAYSNIFSILFGLILVFGFAWLIILSLRLALLQQVAFFEPQVGIRKMFGRSNYLLKKGGQWFIVKGVFLILLVYIIISVVASIDISEVEDSKNVLINLILSLLVILSQSVLTMLYLNRAAVRGQEH